MPDETKPSEAQDLRVLLTHTIKDIEILETRISNSMNYLSLMLESKELPQATKDIVQMIISYLVD